MLTRGPLERIGRGVVWSLAIVGIVSALARYAIPSDLYARIALLVYGQAGTVLLPNVAAHPASEAVHRLGGAAYMMLGLTQFTPRLRARRPALHRNCGRAFLLLSVTSGLGGLWMSIVHPYAGLSETVPTAVFSSIFLYATYRAYVHARRREFAAHREWVIRNFAIGVGIGTIRVVFILLMHVTDMDPKEYFVMSFWLGWVLSLLVGEAWIQSTRTTTVRAPLLAVE